MKTKVMSLMVGLLLVSTSVFAQGVSIDSAGNINAGAGNGSGSLEVTGQTDSDGIVANTSGTGAAIHGGDSTDNYGTLGEYDGSKNIGVHGKSLSGLAGFFEGDAVITGNLDVQGSLSGESDPTVNALGKANLSCNDGEIVQWSGGAWGCATSPSGGAEDDPQVGTLTAGQWCTTDGTQVNCTSNFAHTHPANDIRGGLMENYLEIASHLKVRLYINTEDNYKINGETVLAVPSFNTFVGINAGNTNAGGDNSFFGYNAGSSNLSHSNTFIGSNAGQNNSLSDNTFVGKESGQNNQYGAYNTFVGVQAGQNNNFGSGNVFIGHNAGRGEEVNDKLYIANSATPNPLIHGDFVSNTVTINNVLRLSPRNVPPQASCDSTNAGTIYHDDSSALCWCSGSNWEVLAGAGSCN